MKKNFVKFFAAVICTAIIFTAQISSFAVTIDTSAKASLTIIFTADEKPIPGAEFKLYRIADISRTGKVSLTPPFSDFQIIFKTQTAQEKRTLALTLKGYVISEKIKPDFVGVTDDNGRVSFKNIPLGMYLAVGSSVTIDNMIYVPDALVVTLPAGAENETWDYNVNIRTKTIYENTGVKTNVRVLKVWDDDGDKASRPDKIIVELYSGEKLFDTVTLSKDNNWHYTWKDLPGIDWIVVEKEVPDGYKVSVERDGYSYIITNSKTSDGGQEPDSTTKPGTTIPSGTLPDSSGTTVIKPDTTIDHDTTRPGETKPGITNPGETITGETNTGTATTLPDEDVSGEEPSGDIGETDVSGDSPDDDGENKPTLPQTGMLWWPVPVMALVGILFIMVGWKMNRRIEDEG